MKVLGLGEHIHGKIKDSTLATLGAAAQFGGDVDVLLIGPEAAGAGADAASIAGVSKVLIAADAGLEHELAESVAPLLVKFRDGYDALLASSTTTGRNVAPRVAAGADGRVGRGARRGATRPDPLVPGGAAAGGDLPDPRADRHAQGAACRHRRPRTRRRRS